ncbi:hypothetical protein BGX28_007539 [Mortierella sp. GBA30]|nr:hypothetical protein BGX28_007539 [Mortierella sp. GBA30]
MGSLMAFVHTNFEYKIQHFKYKKMVDFMTTRKDDLKLHMGRDIPHFLIDLDLDEERPVPAFLTPRVIRHILLLARLNIAVSQARYEIRELEEYIKNHDTEDMELVYEEPYEQGWDLFSIREKKAMEFSDVHFIIDDIRVKSQAVD